MRLKSRQKTVVLVVVTSSTIASLWYTFAFSGSTAFTNSSTSFLRFSASITDAKELSSHTISNSNSISSRYDAQPSTSTAGQQESTVDLAAVLYGRRQTARRQCMKLFGPATWKAAQPEAPWFKTSTFVFDKLRLPKVASRSLFTMVQRLNTSHRAAPKDWSIVKRYRKILVVRNPMDRLVSAWRDKFSSRWVGFGPEALPSGILLRQIAAEIIKTYRKGFPYLNLNDEALRNQTDFVTVSEFFQYLKDKGTKTNQHWMNAIDLADPCRVHYDYIVHFENLHQELDYVLRTVTGSRRNTLDSLLPGPERGDFAYDKDRLAATNSLASYVDALPQQLVEAVKKKYKDDYLVFSYQF